MKLGVNESEKCWTLSVFVLVFDFSEPLYWMFLERILGLRYLTDLPFLACTYVILYVVHHMQYIPYTRHFKISVYSYLKAMHWPLIYTYICTEPDRQLRHCGSISAFFSPVKRPDRLWNQHVFVLNGYRGLFPQR